jgi:hypothetical protein
MYLAEIAEGTGFEQQAVEAELLRVLCSSLRSARWYTVLEPPLHLHATNISQSQRASSSSAWGKRMETPYWLAGGVEQDGRRGGVATANSVRPFCAWSYPRENWLGGDRRTRVGRFCNCRGGNHHDLHDQQLPRTKLTGGCHSFDPQADRRGWGGTDGFGCRSGGD